MTEKKPFIFDEPVKNEMSFRVSFDGLGIIFAKRIEVIRKIHHMGCTDDLPDDYEEHRVHWEMTREVDPKVQEKVIELINKEFKLED